MRAVLLLALLLANLPAWDPGQPVAPGQVEPLEIRVVEFTHPGLGSSAPGERSVPDAAGERGLHILLHKMPARGERLLPSPDGRFLAIVRGEVYDLQSQTLIFRNSTLGTPQFWDGSRVVFDNGVVDAARPGWARTRAATPNGVQQSLGFSSGQQGRGRSRYYRIEVPAGQTAIVREWFPTPGYDICMINVVTPGVPGWRDAAVAVDPSNLTVLAAFVGPRPNRNGQQNSIYQHQVLHTLVRDPACIARCPLNLVLACGGFRQAVGASAEKAYWRTDLLPDGRLQRIREPLIPGATISCRWSDDALMAITMQPDRFTQWTSDWHRIGWIDALSFGTHRPLAVDGTRLCLRIEGRAIWCDFASLVCADANPPIAWWRPNVNRSGALPVLNASSDGRLRIPLHPGHPADKVSSGMLPGERAAWCRDGRNLHVLADAHAPLRSFDLGDGGPAMLVAPPDGRTVAVVQPQRVLHLDLASGSTNQIPLDKPIAPADLPQPDNDLALAPTARRWPMADIQIGKELVRIDLQRGTTRRWRLSSLAIEGQVKPGDGQASLVGTLGDGRVVITCDNWPAKPEAEWVVAVDPDGRLPAVRTDACHAMSGFDEPFPGLVTASDPDGMQLWRVDGNHVLRLKADANGAFVVGSDGLVAIPRHLTQAATVVFDGRRAPISAFDLLLNRPDIILKRIGVAPESTTKLLHEAWLRRIARLGLDPDRLVRPANASDLPALRILDRPTGLITTRDRLDLRFSIEGAKDHPVRVQARIGGITVAETKIAAGAGERNGEFRGIQLGRGINRIELAPLSTAGIGIPDRLVLRREGPPGRTVIAALGVSRYRDPSRDLQFAAADARDLASALGARSLVLTDAEVARERLPEIRRHLGQASIDDLAIVVVAGHGLLDRSLQYRIATHDTDFADPAGRGIALDELLDALRASPARRRLVLIDTCHAGEVEPAEMQASLARLGSVSGAAARGLRPARAVATPAKTPPPARPTPGQAARILFQDAGRDDGITILASCRGDEASWESTAWGHGAFTAAVLEGCAGRKADADGDGAIDLAELGAWVGVRVPQLTSDQQHPEVRAGDLDREVIVVPAAR